MNLASPARLTPRSTRCAACVLCLFPELALRPVLLYDPAAIQCSHLQFPSPPPAEPPTVAGTIPAAANGEPTDLHLNLQPLHQLPSCLLIPGAAQAGRSPGPVHYAEAHASSCEPRETDASVPATLLLLLLLPSAPLSSLAPLAHPPLRHRHLPMQGQRKEDARRGGEDRISTESSRAPPRYTPSARSPTGESHLSAGPAWTSQRPRGGLSQFRFGSPAAPCCWPSPHVLGRYLRGPLPDHRRRWQMMAEDVGRPARVAQTGRACSRRHDRAQSPMNDVHHTQSPRGLRARGRVSFVLVVVVLEMAISGAAPVLAVSPLLLASSGFASESLLLRKYASTSPLSSAPPEAVCAGRSVPALRKHMTHGLLQTFARSSYTGPRADAIRIV